MHGVIYGRILPMTGIGFSGAPACRVRETHAFLSTGLSPPEDIRISRRQRGFPKKFEKRIKLKEL